MDKLQLFFEYLVENPGAFRILGMILSTLLLLPYIIIWLKASQVNRIRKAYDELITDQTTTITTLYRNIMDVQGNLAQTRGELDQKIAELKNGVTFIDSLKWNYSRTTIKYLCEFLGLANKKTIEMYINNNTFILTNTNY